jgi:epoxyqueuosine reductase
MDQRERIGQLALEHGFPLCGIAAVPADGAAPRAAYFLDWIARGLHGPLGYLAESAAERANVRGRFAWARSVLCVGALYGGREASGLVAGGDARGTGGEAISAGLLPHVARYARGRDYHLVFEKRLKLLGRAMKAAKLCARTHWYVDTGPVLERAWAATAGLGWIGKNTCLIHPLYGSYVLLGEILIDAELEPDAGLPDHCGTCRRCLDACPTGALRAPRELDAARCISTWNLEMRGELPASGVPSLHGWVAGCDACQTVCPFNAPQGMDGSDTEWARAGNGWRELTLAQTVLLGRDEYDRLFRASALRRVGWKGLRMNAIRAAARSQSPAAREALRACLNDPDDDLRSEAERALSLLLQSLHGDQLNESE